jgi:uncharacterized protein (TIGR02118 family)
MIRVTVVYPNNQECSFDMEYYLAKHIPMVQEKLGAALLGVTVEKGLSGADAGDPPGFVAIAHLLFNSADAFQRAFAPHAQFIMQDIPNFTNIQSVTQIGEVVLSF